MSHNLCIPHLIAHRGYAHRYPENTLLALQAAVAAGARYVEIDVQLTADQIPVLMHDTNLLRTGGLDTPVFTQTAAQLQAYSVGEPQRFGQQFAAEKIPTLAQFAEWLTSHPHVTAFVEIKTESINHFGTETVHQAIWPIMQTVREQVVLISFDDAFLANARLRAPTPIGWVAAKWDDAHAQRAQALAPEYLFTNWDRLPKAPETLWQGPWHWAVYEVVDADFALDLAARGIAFVESMAIGELLGHPRLTAPHGHVADSL